MSAAKITVVSLTDKESQSKNEMNLEIKRIMEEVNTRIREAHKDKLRFCAVPLPSNFEIAYTSNKTAQIIIYSEVIDLIKSSPTNFSVKFDQKNYILNISWISEQDKSDMERRQRIIDNATH